MKLFAKKIISTILLSLTALNMCAPAYAEERCSDVLVSDIDPIAKTKQNASIYGYDLTDDLKVNDPVISDILILGTNVEIIGRIDNEDETSSFHLAGKAYKTYDNNICCNMIDKTDRYDVIFTCFEKKKKYNDYILYRDSGDYSSKMGEYGLKIYLSPKGTRDISIIEDTAL